MTHKSLTLTFFNDTDTNDPYEFDTDLFNVNDSYVPYESDNDLF